MPISRIRKPAGVRSLGPVDATALVAQVRRLSDRAWAGEDALKENTFEMFHHTRHVIFRFIPNNLNPCDFYSTHAWPVWRGLLEPVMEAVVRPYGFERPVYPKAMLARLEAGAIIDPHVDGAGSHILTHKIHVPLITNPGALFLTGEDTCHLEAGQAYEVNNIGRHGAMNHGLEDRIHFIFEVFEGAGLGVGAE